MSAGTFGNIRQAADIKITETGGAAAKHLYSPADVRAMIRAAESGGFSPATKKAVKTWKSLLENVSQLTK